jgi:hypothetical protein
MTTATATASTPAVAPEVNLADMTAAQLSERMSKLAERHDTLKASVSEFESVSKDLQAAVGEFNKRFGILPPTVKKGNGAPRAPRQRKDGDKAYPSLKEVVLGVLGANPDGLELKGIVGKVQEMIDRKEYASNAKSLSAVVAQAVNALKQEKLIEHDRESKRYSKSAA